MRKALPLFALAALLGGCSLGSNDSGGPRLGATADQSQAAEELGFPTLATRNTIRVGGGDPVADVAGTVSAVFPATSDETRPHAVVLVDKSDWQGAVAASVLTADPLAAPILASDGGDLPAASEDALKRLKPRGADLARDAQVLRVGSKPPAPGGFKSGKIGSGDPYETAAAIDKFFTAIRGKPSPHVTIASGEQAPYAMPAAAWAARSGDSVLFTRKTEVPPATLKAVEAHDKPDIFILGPEAVIAPSVEKQLEKLGRVRRVEGATPVANAIALARYRQRGYGWGVTVPGYNFTLAGVSRPFDAAAAATLATNGVYAPLLLTDSPSRLPSDLSSYLLDVQPGFEDDPGSGVYNRVWILGDEKIVSGPIQGRLDEITGLVAVEARRP